MNLIVFKKQTLKIAALISCMAIVVSCSKSKNDGPQSPDSGYPKEVTIEYKITSPDLTKANVIFSNETGGNSNVSDAALPFTKTFKRTVKYAEAASIGVTSYTGGNIKAEIFVDGKSVKTESYSGNQVVTGSLVYPFM